jgi:hypothetical protein
MSALQKLDAAIKAVCPIHGVSIGTLADKQTWRIDFKDEATSAQRAAAQGVVDTFDLAAAQAEELANAARATTDETERVAVKGEAETQDWLNKTPAQAAQWVDDTHAARITAGDTQVQAVLFILRKMARLLLIVARRSLR